MIPSNIKDWVKNVATDSQARQVRLVSKFVDDAGLSILGGTSVGKDPQTLILDLTRQGGEIVIEPNGSKKLYGEYFKNFEHFKAILKDRNKLWKKKKLNLKLEK